MLPNDNVSMSIGHLDHVSTVYSLMEHVLQLSRVKAAFHYSSQLVENLVASRSKACRQLAANLLKTVFFLHFICLARA